MDEVDASIETLYRRGSEQLTSDSSLRDALDDDQAQQLIDWGLGRVRVSAEKARALPAPQAEALMEATVKSIRGVMRQTNRLVEQSPQGGDDMYVAVLRLVEALHELDGQTIQLQDLMALEKLALNRGDLERSAVFAQLMALIGGDGEEEE